jgi:hypothetical protein
MEMFFWSQGLYFRGKVKDLAKTLGEFPPHLTLGQLINLKLN